MKSYCKVRGRTPAGWCLALVLVLLMGTFVAANTQAFTLNVVWADQDGNSGPVAEYRWLLQEDTTYDLGPGNPEQLSLNFHKSYAPPVAKGDQTSGSIVLPDTSKRYFVSVLPAAGYTIGGAPVVGNPANVTVTVTPLPLPTAQISVFVFRDDYPINNAPDFNEPGLEGFKVTLEDAGGRYGMSAGAQMMDAFGNPIGTVYGQNGNVVKMGDGVVTTDADGNALIQNLAPGKYGVSVVPPLGEGWIQTSTIEGKRVIDAWVKANEPPFFVEFGPPGVHVFIGFVKQMNNLAVGSNSISGRIVNLHNSRPPDFTFWPGHPIPGAWVGLNNGPAGTGQGVYAAPCDDNSEFTINGIPNGTYELVIWDENLDVVFAFKNVTVPDPVQGADVDLGNVGVFNWFGRLEGGVFEDTNLDGVWDPDEEGIPEQAINIRWRDGTMYQSMPTDLEGLAPFDEVFPFFNWLVGEVDFARLQATGATFVVDAGGEVAPGEVLNPQEQYQDCDGAYLGLSRTETGEVLTQAFQVFLGQTVRMEFGKAPYNPDDNGGISGIVYYATTRAEDDPGLAAAEPWEPGIPRVQVNLYADELNNDTGVPGSDGKIDPKVPATYPYIPVLADVDNYPFGWSDGGARGPEDIDRNDNGDFDWGDAIDITWTDSWDDNQPDCAMGSNSPAPGSLFGEHDAFDGLRNFNQARPGVFDGGYAFGGLEAGIYIVEAVAPPGYEHVKEEDKNVDFGDEYTGPFIPIDGNPAMPGDPPGNTTPEQIPLDNQAIPVGDLRMVPTDLSLFPGVPTRFGGEMRPLPDRKQVELKPGLNSACDFFLFTEVPVAGQIVGIILDDTANEFDPAAPAFGEKYAPPFLPISIRDWAGNLIGYTVSDKYGAYNALVPSTYTANLPQPSGMSPHMLTVILNDPTHPTVAHNPKYSQFSYTFQYMPGTTTYLDTPVLPIAAFAGPDQFPVDSEFPDGTPVVKQVVGGPYVAAAGTPITIQSMGTVQVPNPDYDGSPPPSQFIPRDYGFGSPGTVTIGGEPLTNVIWSSGSITGTVAPGTTTGQLVVTRGDNGKSSVLGVTVTVGGPMPIQVPGPAPSAIQNAIDTADPGDLILVGPGVYEELVIMHKPVQLQGHGAGVTFINAVQVPSEKILNWRDKIRTLWTAGAFDLLPAQELDFAGLEPALAAVEGAGISVFARNTTQANGGFGPDPRARIDGFTVEGASTGGGIFVNGYAHFLEISNNRVRLNSAAQGGGITIGHPALVLETGAGLEYQDAGNDHTSIHNNQVSANGGLGGAGGGVSLYTGAHYYEVKDNFIVGNFMQSNGGGIGHLGRSDGGVIAHNTIAFNQSFNQGVSVSGGGIFIGGAAPLVLGGLTEGSGSVTADGNLIQGNLAGAGDGGGIRTQLNLPGDIIDIINNMVVNNVAGLAGGGIAMQDTENINIFHNTVARNDSTATAGAAFATANMSTPQPAGIMSRNSNAVIDSNIIWENRSFYFEITNPTTFGLQLDGFSDLGPAGLPTTNCLFTGDLPATAFVAPYFNSPRGTTILIPEFTTTPSAMPAFDEGGNFIDVRFGPLSIEGTDYHVMATIGGGTLDLTTTDVDGDLAVFTPYIGADLYVPSGNMAPVAANDAYNILLPNRGLPNPLVVADPGLLANDFDPNGDPLAVDITPLVSPSNGTLVLSANGAFTYTPTRRFEGTDTFSYLLYDGFRYSMATVTITVTIKPANQAPVPTAADIFTQINTPGTTRVLPNDPDVGDTHTYSIVGGNPQDGTVTVSAGGTVTYTPDLNFQGTDSVTVRVRDQDNRQDTVTINVTVSLNLAPSQDVVVQIPPDEDGIDTDGDGDPANDNAYLLLGAGDGFSTMADGYEQYIFSFRNLSHLLPAVMPGDPAVRIIPMDMIMHHGMLGAEWPASTIRVKEGQKLYLNLVNVGMAMRPDLFDPHTVHWHGFPQASSVFDGVPDASISVNMMGILTYFYNVVEPGTYMYHCHVEATEHMQMGMLGNLYVTPKQDNRVGEPGLGDPTFKGFAYNDGDGSTGYHVDYPIQIGSFDPAFHDASLTTQPLPFQLMEDKYPMLNGRGYPDTLKQGSLPPAGANTYVETASVVNAPAPQAGSFHVSGPELEMVNDAYNGLDLVFTSGSLKGSSRRIADYTITQQGPNTRIKIDLANALPQKPSAGDTFAIGKASQNVSSRIEATQGQKILLRISDLNVTRFYTLASAIPMKVVGLNARLLRGPDGKDLYYTTNSVTLGGGEAVDAIIDTTDVAPGTYLLYTPNLNYLSNNQEDFGGMMTEIVITAP